MARDAAGFTLVEVLVAAAVLAAGILGFLQALLTAERLGERSRAVTGAALLAEEGIERVAALGWDRAVAGLPLESHPGLAGTADPLPAARHREGRIEYLVLFRRGDGGGAPPRSTVACFWAADAGPPRAGDAVVLRTRHR